LPRLRGPRLDGLPQTLDGFIPVDAHGRVSGLEDVYAAGDITNFPVKQGGIATQQADAAAEAIAQAIGVDLVPEPFRPVLRGLLLTGGQPRYLRRELAESGQAEMASPDPLWWPPAKIVGRSLAPFLAEFTGVRGLPKPVAEPGTIRIEVDLAARDLDGLAAPRLEATGQGDTAAEAMSADLLVVSPGAILGDVAQTMRDLETGSAAVAVDGKLIGILTSRDLLRAFAARVRPSHTLVREWMTAEPVTVTPSTRVEAAVSLMIEHGVHRLPVVEGRRPVGMLGFRQAARRARGRGIGLGF
jgi:CBS domain-containing protein